MSYFFTPTSKGFKDASKKYRGIYEDYIKKSNDYSDFMVPGWRENETKIKYYFMDKFNNSFLNNPIIRSTMFMDFAGEQQKNELNYLKNRIPEKDLKQLLKENNIGNPTITNFHYNTSHNTIHHLTHLFKFLDVTKNKVQKKFSNIHQVVEWGGGYGNLAKIFLKLNPEVTYIIIDIPVFSFIQAIYLSVVCDKEKINLILNQEDSIEKGKINIIPLNESLLNNLNITNTDLFISTWALSESTKYAIEYVTSKNFFNAKYLLIAHQAKSEFTPYSETIKDNLSKFNILYHEKIPLLKNNYYLFAEQKNEI